MAAFDPELVVLAGFMRIIGPAMLARFPSSIINVHPALLPSFPGLNAPQQALEAGVRITGCTVHLVDSGVDTGPILAQAAVPISPHDNVCTLVARIQRAEHQLLPNVIDWIASGQLQLEPTPKYNKARLGSAALFSPAVD